jgi:hypothetical protein
MKKIFTTLTLSCLIFFGADAQTTQRNCSSPFFNETYEEAFQLMLRKHEQFANNKKALTIYNIPVVFHIIHNGEAVGVGRNISKAQVASQITILNEDYRKMNTDFSTWVTQTSFVNAAADCEINFCLANIDPSGNELAEPGIDRIDRNSKGWAGPSYQGYPEPGGYIDNTIKSGSYWDPDQYMNIWVIDMSDNVLGYAQFPTIETALSPVNDMYNYGGLATTDGVVLEYRAVGNVGAATAPFNKGRTATHEIGHWLGLWHINGDSNCGNDYVSDTPEQSSLTTGCPNTIGSAVAAGCSNSPNPPGKMYQNYMDYSDDRCLTLFTTGQKARMQAVLANCIRRNSLTTSTVCNAVSVKENAFSLNFRVYPNPTDGDFFVDVNLVNNEDFVISIFNTLGQTVKEVKRIQSNGGEIKIDLPDKNKGVYFVSIKTKSASIVKRIVIQ